MVQLFPDFKELHGSSPAAIVASANDPQSSGQALVDLSGDLVDDVGGDTAYVVLEQVAEEATG